MSYQNQRYPQQYPQQRRRRSSAFSGLKLRLIIGAAIVLFSVVSFMNKGEINPVTGKKQRVDMSIQEEINNGLASVGQMGPQSRNRRAQDHVDEIGFQLVRQLQQRLYSEGIEIPYPFDFHLLAKPEINAFALPGGQVFITEALYRALEGTPDQHDARLAGVLGHEIGHVIERHGAERMAKGNLISGIVGAAGVAGGDMSGRSMASYVGNLVNMKYGRGDELESDEWGLELMMLANYDPSYLLDVMEVLKRSGGGTPEFLSTHPSSETRVEKIKEYIVQNRGRIEDQQNRRILNIE